MTRGNHLGLGFCSGLLETFLEQNAPRFLSDSHAIPTKCFDYRDLRATRVPFFWSKTGFCTLPSQDARDPPWKDPGSDRQTPVQRCRVMPASAAESSGAKTQFSPCHGRLVRGSNLKEYLQMGVKDRKGNGLPRCNGPFGSAQIAVVACWSWIAVSLRGRVQFQYRVSPDDVIEGDGGITAVGDNQREKTILVL